MENPKTSLLRLQPYRNIIFDLDGTLILSNEGHAHSFIDAFEANGIQTIQFNEIRQLIGMSGKTILQHVLPAEIFQEKGEKIEQDHLRIFRERYLPQVQPIPGVFAVMELLKSQGIKIAISTASPRDIVNHLIERLDIQNLIEGATSNEDVPAGKPDPAAIEVCCQKFGFAPRETLFIGDSPYNIIAAHAYSLPVIAVLTGGYQREDLLKTGALAVYQDITELSQHDAETLLNSNCS